MDVSKRVDQRIDQISKMPPQEGRAYLERLEQQALADDRFNQALQDDENWEIAQSVDEDELERLTELADDGVIQAMYDIAAVFTLIGYELQKENEQQKSFLLMTRANLYVDEAQKAK